MPVFLILALNNNGLDCELFKQQNYMNTLCAKKRSTWLFYVVFSGGGGWLGAGKSTMPKATAGPLLKKGTVYFFGRLVSRNSIHR